MRKLTNAEFKTAQLQAKLFELSVDQAEFSSPMFIRRFMTNDIAKQFIDLSYIVGSTSNESIIDQLNTIYMHSTRQPLYTKNGMYWIGYIYATICFLYSKNPKGVYKLFPAKKMRDYYNVYHTFDVEQAAERMMENIGETEDLNKKAYLLLKKNDHSRSVGITFRQRNQGYRRSTNRINSPRTSRNCLPDKLRILSGN